MQGSIFTIGHSTRSLDELVEALKAHNVHQLVDIRSVPRSRHNPQFNKDKLSKVLPGFSIDYVYLEKLGGLRKTNKDSINMGWHNASFRGYADYMQTDDFLTGLKQLEDLAKKKPTAIMCAEAVPWRCHRSMIGDALLVRKHKVIDIFDINKTQDEKLTSFAKVKGKTITYPDDGESEEKTAKND